MRLYTNHLDTAPAPLWDGLAVWNRRLLTGAIVLILCGASMLAIHAAGPHAQAMLAGEGMLINPAE